MAFSTMIALSQWSNSRARQKMRPAFTPYSSMARSMPRSAAWMMWSRSSSESRLRFIGLKRSSICVTRLPRYSLPITS